MTAASLRPLPAIIFQALLRPHAFTKMQKAKASQVHILMSLLQICYSLLSIGDSFISLLCANLDILNAIQHILLILSHLYLQLDNVLSSISLCFLSLLLLRLQLIQILTNRIEIFSGFLYLSVQLSHSFPIGILFSLSLSRIVAISLTAESVLNLWQAITFIAYLRPSLLNPLRPLFITGCPATTSSCTIGLFHSSCFLHIHTLLQLSLSLVPGREIICHSLLTGNSLLCQLYTVRPCLR